MSSVLKSSIERLSAARQYRPMGRVKRVRGLIIESSGPRAALGDLCSVVSGSERRLAEVVGFQGNTTLLMALEDMARLSPDDEVLSHGRPLTVGVGPALLGRVVNGLGLPIDDKGPITAMEYRSLYADAPLPLSRARVSEPLSVGVRAIDGMLTVGQGQRVGIFSGSGVGKSNLLGMMARYTSADVVVIGLVGERGREVKEFIEKNLGEQGRKKSVVVSETSDRWPLQRIKAALTATTIAEYFRDHGLRVLLLMDSITRVCHALREVGLSLGEPPATKGYPPSVFAALPKLLERAGNSALGSITGLYTVLVDGDDMMEPIADSARSILDGHIVLSRKLAARNHYPAVDILNSVSRVMPDVVTADHVADAGAVKEWLAAYTEAEDLISIGAYAKGSMPKVDKAIEKLPAIDAFLRQHMDESSFFAQTSTMLANLASRG
jgi:flagellum-specific ATP synthase